MIVDDMVKQPLVSICVPTYNAEQFIAESIQSLIAQTYPNIEILVVDDGSTDRTEAIILEFKKLHPTIRYIKNERNLGLVQNWNKCVQEATGEWIKFHFHDDLARPDCVSEMIDSALNSATRLLLCDRIYLFEKEVSPVTKNFLLKEVPKLSDFFSSDAIVTPHMFYKLWYDDLLGYNFLGEPIVGIFKKEVINEYGLFDTTLNQIVDFEYWARIACNESFYYLNKPLVTFRVHNKSASSVNSSQKVSIPALDRYILAYKIMHSSYFEKFRSYTNSNFSDLNRELDRRLLKMIGYKSKSLKDKLVGLQLKFPGIIPDGYYKRYWLMRLKGFYVRIKAKLKLQ